MKSRPLIVAIAGLIATGAAIIFNLTSAVDVNAGRGQAIESGLAALIALIYGVITFRRGGGWRFLAIAMIGPSVFVIADAGIRLALYLSQGV